MAGGASFFALTVFARGLLDRLFTRAYLPGESDGFLAALPEAERDTLQVVREDDGSVRFDVRLQGEGETVFLQFPASEDDRPVEAGLVTSGRRRRRPGPLAAMLRVEVAWARALVVAGLATAESAAAVAAAAEVLRPDPVSLAAETEAAGNPVAPLVALLRDGVGSAHAGAVHRGLTSQDVLDTALVLLARDGLMRVATDLRTTGDALAELARAHRDTVAVGRTLTQSPSPRRSG